MVFSMFTELRKYRHNLNLTFSSPQKKPIPVSSHSSSSPFPQLSATTNLSVSRDLSVEICLDMVFCDWLFSLNLMFSCPFMLWHVSVFISFYCQVTFHYSIQIYHILVSHFMDKHVSGHLGSFYFLGDMSNSAMNICVQVLHGYLLSSLLI